MDVPIDILESKIKNAIEEEFIYLSQGIAPTLRGLINSNKPGNIVATFEEFKQHLDALFMLTSNKKELDKTKVKTIEEWLNTKHKPSIDDMQNGLKLFNEYKAELFRMNVIKIG